MKESTTKRRLILKLSVTINLTVIVLVLFTLIYTSITRQTVEFGYDGKSFISKINPTSDIMHIENNAAGDNNTNNTAPVNSFNNNKQPVNYSNNSHNNGGKQ
jgi:glucan phosphoethanolaminetransferase (alkaline phosphatase superfamily)